MPNLRKVKAAQRQNDALKRTMEKLDTQLTFLDLILDGHSQAAAWNLAFGDDVVYNQPVIDKLLSNKPLNRMAARVNKLKNLQIDEENDVKKIMVEEMLTRIPLATDADSVKLIHEIALLMGFFNTASAGKTQVEVFWNDFVEKKTKKKEKTEEQEQPKESK